MLTLMQHNTHGLPHPFPTLEALLAEPFPRTPQDMMQLERQLSLVRDRNPERRPDPFDGQPPPPSDASRIAELEASLHAAHLEMDARRLALAQSAAGREPKPEVSETTAGESS